MNNRLFTFVISIFWAIIVIIVVLSNVSTPISIPYSKSKTIFTFSPQGWGFFTRNPREDIAKIYSINNEKVTPVIVANSNRKFMFGLSKKAKLVSWEISNIIDQIKEEDWVQNNRDTLLFNTKKIDTIKNSFFVPSLKGGYIISIQERIPHAWSKHHENIVMPYKYVRVYVQ